MSIKSEKAVELFANGFNCSQAVLTAFASELGLDEEFTLKLGTSFGSGARNGEICGAVSGALMVLGLKYGHCHIGNDDEKAANLAITTEYTRRFREANGSVVCRDLLGYDLSKPDELALIREKGLFTDICPKMIKSAVEVLEELLAEQE